MVDRSQVDALVSMANKAAQSAHAKLTLLLQNLPSDPSEAQKFLLASIPLLIEEGADEASAGAELWYQEIRQQALTSSFQTLLGPGPDALALDRNIRSMSAPLFTKGKEGQEATGRLLAQLVERKVKDGARSTILANALKDPAATRFARVPAGAETCAWCFMLASRGWVYATKESASKAKKTGDSFHAGCDCQIVPAFGEQTPEIEGYNPDSLYEQYLFGRREFEFRNPGIEPDDRDIAATMRRLLPGLYRRGYAPDPGDIPFVERESVILTEAFRHHVLVGRSGKGGHFHSSPRPRKTKFPAWWSEADIWQAVEDVFYFGVAEDRGSGLIQFRGYSRGVHINLLVRDGIPQTIYPLDGDGVNILGGDEKLSPIPLTPTGRGSNDVYSHRLG